MTTDTPPQHNPRSPSSRPDPRGARWTRWLTILFAALSGLYLLAGGIWLVSVRGSPYYAIAGVAMLAVAWLVLRRNRWALALYGLLLIGTLAWAVGEAG